MADINTALAASKEAIDQLIRAGKGRAGLDRSTGAGQVVAQSNRGARRPLARRVGEHGGWPSVEVPKLPAVAHPVVRSLLFKRVLRNAGFPKAKTNKAMNPASGPATPAEGRARLETAHQKFAEACRQIATHGERMRTTIFGAVPVEDYVRFMQLHTRHHVKQMPDRH